MTPRSPIPRWAGHHRIKLNGEQDTAETLCGRQATAKSINQPRNQRQNLLVQTAKKCGNSRCPAHRGVSFQNLMFEYVLVHISAKLKSNTKLFLRTGAFLYAPYSSLLITNKFWKGGRGRIGRGQWERWTILVYSVQHYRITLANGNVHKIGLLMEDV